MKRPQDQYSAIYYSTLIASIGGLIVGYSTVIVSGVLLFLDNVFKLQLVQQEIVVSIAILAAVIGVIVGGVVCNWFGRKPALLLSAVIFMIASVLSFFSDRYLILVISRGIMGLGAGIASLAVPLYISELVPSNIRGSSVCLMTLLFYMGVLLAYLINVWLVKSGSWKFTLSSPFIPALGLFIGMCYMPETPQWLLGNFKHEKAIQSLKRLRRFVDVELEIENIKESSQFAERDKEKFKKTIFKAGLIGCGVAFFMEVTGAHSVFYYIPTVLNKTGLWTRQAAIDASMYIGVVCFVGAILALSLIDRHGRRKLLVWGTSLMVFSLFSLAILFHFTAYCHCHHGLMMILFLLFALGYILGLGSVGWLLIAEIFPLKYRSVMMATAISVKWGTNFVISRFFLTQLTDFGGSLTFLTYGFIGVIAYLFIYFFVPETGGKSLEAIEEQWINHSRYGFEID